MKEENEGHLSYIKVINAGEKLVINRHVGNLQAKVGYWLMNLHITPRTIYLTRHGESEFNVQGKIGGDSGLSERGKRYSKLLAEHINQLHIPGIRVWTSEMRRTVETARRIQGPKNRYGGRKTDFIRPAVNRGRKIQNILGFLFQINYFDFLFTFPIQRSKQIV